MIDKIIEVRKKLKEKNPLIHSITNPISINQCANAIIGIGGKPIMAEHPKEVKDITVTSSALMLNLGNITDVRMESMEISAKIANEHNIPYMLDAVGVACSELRREYAYNLIEKYSPAMIKGNYSEINALYYSDYTSEGVDTDLSLSAENISKVAVELSKKYNAVILASGKIDIITDGNKVVYVKNGTSQLSCITGTGCMLGALCTGYLAVERGIEAAVTACVVMGISGEKSVTDKGNGTFMVNLLDNVSTLSDEDIKEYINLEECSVEKI